MVIGNEGWVVARSKEKEAERENCIRNETESRLHNLICIITLI